MAVIVTMPDGTEQEFPDLSSAKSYKQRLLSDPNVGGALRMTGGDLDQSGKTLGLQKQGVDLQKGGLEVQKMQRELEAPSAAEDVSRGINTYEDTLRSQPVAERGPYAIAQGKWKKAMGWMGWNPQAADVEGQRNMLARKMLKGSGDSRPSDKDLPMMLAKVPDLDEPMETRRQKFSTMREMLNVPPRSNMWDTMQNAQRRFAVQAPQGEIK